MRREPVVPEAEAQVEECLDCRARVSSKELAQRHSVKSGISQSACSTSQKMDADLVKKCSYAHRKVDEQPCKRSEKNGDKSAVAKIEGYTTMVLRISRRDPIVFASIASESLEKTKSGSQNVPLSSLNKFGETRTGR